jgi:hypothetical protein
MNDAWAIWEERRTVLKRGALQEYRRMMLDEVWPALAGAGMRPLCLLSGLIGMSAEDVYSFTGFHDAAAWTGATESAALQQAVARLSEFVAEESVRLHRASPVRPKPETPKEDRRAIYGMRRFTIRAADWPAFLEHSSEGVWRRIEAQDARILGLFRDAAGTDPLEVTLLTGYHGPGHWEETRFWRDRPTDFPEDLWEQGRQAQVARNAITLRSHVCLMTAHWPR